MSMNQEQLAVLADDITTSTKQNVQDALAAEDYAELANLYNQESTEYAWKPQLEIDEYMSATVWTEYEALTQPKRESWEAMTGVYTRSMNLEDPNIQAGMMSVWTGDTRDNLMEIGILLMTEAELLFATGAGNGNQGNPYNYGWQGTVTEQDVTAALGAQYVSNEVTLTNEKNR